MRYFLFLLLFIPVLIFSCAGNRVQKLNVLPDRTWKLVELDGRTIEYSGERHPYAVFKTADSRVYGSGGCNRYSGSFKVSGQKITISQLISTKMACMEIDYENVFLRTLESSDEFVISGDSLYLKNNGSISARFVISETDSSSQTTQ